MSIRDPDAFNGEYMRQRWAGANALKLVHQPVGIRQPLEALVDKRRSGLVEKAREYEDLEYPVFDHDAYFVSPTRPQSVAAIVTAPYLGAVRRELGSTAELHHQAQTIAAALGLFVRVGHPADTIHLSRWPDEPTVPIVWWNADRVMIDVPPIEDPYPAFANDEPVTNGRTSALGSPKDRYTQQIVDEEFDSYGEGARRELFDED